MNQLLKLILAGVLILCFFKMSYGFYRISEFALFAGFGWLAYDAFHRRDSLDVKIFVTLTIFYNPFIGLPIPNILQVIVNVIVIIGLVINILFAQENPYEDYTKKDDR
ncbi:DUF6804 family protein [Epilithonimonas arachidiradicis]|uniref:Uncharacterized protein n=1 Tax=Epilithonimonas arachidiradicis TaxID=1617282 RepID=A0A420DAE0_9FLAO|nr:DUF6804 family protein [Epilithonimonas arachidiradicis]RKE88248.1 hypothetical protein BXY58_1393 [Epilithonimonas arachidiradicis]GGG50229.1 hypothetical protein GCM10007332_09840 [Epilithonimonas arachidiradicis]